MSDPAASPTADLKDTLEEMRASVAARGARKGLRGAIQEAVFSLLEVLLALLADFRAGRLAPVAEDAADGGDCTVAHPSARPTGSILGSSPRTVAKPHSPQGRGRRSVRVCGWERRRPKCARAHGVRGRARGLPLTLPLPRVNPRVAPEDGGGPLVGPLRGPTPQGESVSEIRTKVRSRHCAGWRNTPGMRRALPPYRAIF